MTKTETETVAKIKPEGKKDDELVTESFIAQTATARSDDNDVDSSFKFSGETKLVPEDDDISEQGTTGENDGCNQPGKAEESDPQLIREQLGPMLPSCYGSWQQFFFGAMLRAYLPNDIKHIGFC